MKKESEKLIERTLSRKVKDIGGWSLKLCATFVAGLPDRLVLLPGGKIIFVEVKTTGQKPRRIQVFIHNKLRQLGFKVYVIDSIKGIKNDIKEISGKD